MEKADKRKYAEDKPLVCEDCYFWVALMENILLVLDTVCRKFYRT